ncbi:MAG: glycosyltransferase [Gemmatimonas sp.]|nr:glycosyltransferase [Gemmatimonas sp.]
MSTTDRPTISVLVITLNEERMLDRVLESVRWADEIVIVDSGSTDRTEEIARRYTSHFYVLPYEGHGIQRQRTYELSTGGWILYIDADEIVTPALRDSILSSVRGPGGRSGFRMQLHTWFLGRWFGRSGWRKEWKVRLFRRDRGAFDGRAIHEGARVEGPIGTLSGALLHYPYRDLTHAVEKMNRYSTSMVDMRLSSGRTSSAPAAVLRGFGRFFRDYIAGGEFLLGGPGLIRSTLNAYYTFLKYAKLWERSNAGTVPTDVARAPSHGPPEPRQ